MICTRRLFAAAALTAGLAAAYSQGVTAPALPPPAAPAAGVRAEGRVVSYPGAEVTLSTEIAAPLARRPAREKIQVHRGDLLAELTVDEQRAELSQAHAQLTESESEVHWTEREVQRLSHLHTSGGIAEQVLDHARRERDAAVAHRDHAAATLRRAEVVVARARIVAPIDGTVVATYAEAGEFVPAGTRVATVADLARSRIEAEVDEYDAAHVHVGARARITAEGHPGAAWDGTVEEVPDRVGGRTLRPQDPGHPTDTRVLLVKIAFHPDGVLKLGQRVEVELQ